MKWFWLLLVVCGIGGYMSWSGRAIEHPPGVLVTREPAQKPLSKPESMFERNGYQIKPLASFEVEARVLSRRDYWFDPGAGVSPVDLALGWGRMSDSAILNQFEISQNYRFFYWSAPVLPIPLEEIISHAANMHMIPASRTIEKRLKSLRQGHLVKFSGYLVEVQDENGYHWRSSLTRTDSGNGACEVVWVESLEVVN